MVPIEICRAMTIIENKTDARKSRSESPPILGLLADKANRSKVKAVQPASVLISAWIRDGQLDTSRRRDRRISATVTLANAISAIRRWIAPCAIWRPLATSVGKIARRSAPVAQIPSAIEPSRDLAAGGSS